jgi:hypothetical protein
MMSSEISTDLRVKTSKSKRGKSAAPRPGPPEAGATPDAGFKPWHFFVLASLVAATAAVILSRQPHPVNLTLVSVIVGAAGLAGYGLYRTLAPLALDEQRQGTETIGERARAGLAREKMLVLRSIKELEFDRAMGKVSEGDFQDMAARLRVRAIALMKQLDQTGDGYRDLIEQELRTRLGRRGAAAAATAEPAEAGDVDGTGPDATAPAGARDQVAACTGCGTINDEDARFCKRCGQALHAS